MSGRFLKWTCRLGAVAFVLGGACGQVGFDDALRLVLVASVGHWLWHVGDLADRE